MIIFLNKVSEFIEKIAAKKIWPFSLVGFFLIVIVTNGVSFLPFPKYQLLSIDPFSERQETILLPIFGYITNLNSPINFTGLCSFIILIAYTLFVFFSKRRHSVFLTILVSTILFTNPISTILLSWVGSPDGLTFLLTIPFLFVSSPFLFFILAFLGTTNHITLLFAVIEIVILRLLSREKLRAIHLVLVIMSCALGLFIVKIFAAGGISRFDFLISRGLSSWIDHNLSQLPLTLFSLFNVQWIILISCLIKFFKKDKIYYSFVLLFVLFNYCISFFSLDTTRIFSLLSWGVFIHCVYRSYEISQKLDPPQKQKQFQLILIVIILLSLVLPRFFSWEGVIIMSPFHESLARIFNF